MYTILMNLAQPTVSYGPTMSDGFMIVASRPFAMPAWTSSSARNLVR
jgi:hypothetical protein